MLLFLLSLGVFMFIALFISRLETDPCASHCLFLYAQVSLFLADLSQLFSAYVTNVSCFF